MITREEYDEALNIVEAYHKQMLLMHNQISRSNPRYKRLDESEIGDFVKCVEVHGNSAENLTIGKSYEIINKDENYIYIISDKGNKKGYSLKNTQFKLC